MPDIERTITEPTPEFIDIRIRRNGTSREMLVAFRVERENFQAVRNIDDRHGLLNQLNALAVSMIAEQYGLDGFTQVL
jgi:hypothetical protein